MALATTLRPRQQAKLDAGLMTPRRQTKLGILSQDVTGLPSTGKGPLTLNPENVRPASPGTGPAAPGTGILSGLLGGNDNNDMETTGSVTAQPWGPTRGPLKGILSDAGDLYTQQQDAWNPHWAKGENLIATMADQTHGIIDKALGSTQNIATGMSQIGTEGDYRGVLANAQNPGAAENYLTATASGQYLNNPDPYLETILNDTNAKTQTALQDIYSGAGRYGGATMNRDIIDRRFANEAGAKSAAYQAERDRQMNAANSIEAAQQGRLGLQQGILGDIAGVQNQNIGNRLAGSSMMPALADARYMGADRLMQLGDFRDQKPWRNLQRYAQLVGGISGQGGTSVTSEPETPLWQKILGGISGGLGILGGLQGLGG